MGVTIKQLSKLSVQDGASLFIQSNIEVSDAVCRLLEKHIKAPGSLRCSFTNRQSGNIDVAEFKFVFAGILPGSYRIDVACDSVVLANGFLRFGIPYVNGSFIDALKDAVAEMAKNTDNAVTTLVESKNMKALYAYARRHKQ